MIRKLAIFSGVVGTSLLLVPAALAAPGTTTTSPGFNISVNGQGSTSPSTTVEILVLLTVLTLLPSVLIMMTSFTRIIIVLGFLRNALGAPSIPPNQVLIGLSLFLTLFTMAPTLKQIDKVAVKPYTHHQMNSTQALKAAEEPIREFMFKQTKDKDIALFVDIAHEKRPKTRADVPTTTLIPAFLLSELKTAFEIGFLIYIPFLIIDMVVASVLMGMGMVMLPPVLISLPFKILLFVLVDGWVLLTQALVGSFF